MRSRILKWELSAIVLIGLIFLFFIFARQSSYEIPFFKSVAIQQASGLPARITIPSINVDAAIEHVGLASDGSMDIPKFPANAAWYQPGPRPGEIGSAVIDGHVNWKNGARAVFTDLHRLKPGDKVSVTDNMGVVSSFVVRTSRVYDPDADATEVFVSNDGWAHLNLITCVGIWNEAAQSYSKRFVVFTDKEY